MKIRNLLITIFSWVSFIALGQLPTNPELFNNGLFPANWLVADNGVGTAVSWQTTNLQPCEGTRMARCQREDIGINNTSQDWLISNQFTVPANGQLQFIARSGSAGNQGSIFKVFYSTNATQGNLASYTLLQQFTEDELSATFDTCENKIINLPIATVGTQIYLAFVREHTQTGTVVGGDIFFLDNVRVLEQCIVPTGLTSNSVTATTATLSWTPPGAANIFIGAVAPVATTVPTHTNVTSPYNLTGLTPNTQYCFYVRAICSSGNSPWTTTAVCFTTPVAPLGCGGNFVDSGGVNANYSNSENLTTTICSPNAGEIVQVTFTSFDTEASYDKLYIYDSNGPLINQISSGNTAGQGPCNTPGGFWGNTLPPVIIASNPSGCLTFRFCSDSSDTRPGWVANVVCIPGPACDRPTNLTATNFTQSTATLSWTDTLTPATTQWELIIQAASLPPPNNNAVVNPANIVTSSTFNATNLPNCLSLKYYVRAICANGLGNSFWAASGTFSTPASNNECINAVSVPVNTNASCTTVVAGCLSGTTSSSQPNACVGSSDDDVWFSFVASSTTHIISLNNIVGTTQDLVHVLYSGTCGALTQVNCSDPESSVVNNLVPGQTYYIRVYTFTATPNQIVNFNVCVGVLPSCSNADPFCTGTGVVFNNTTNIDSLGQIGCLLTTPNPAWFFLQIDNPGDLRLNISQTSNTGGVLDVDYVAWGPFTSTTAACAAIPTNPLPDGNPPGGNALHGCSYDSTSVEYMYLPTVTTGQVYMVLITNFSNQAGTITFNQIGGTASTDCSILCPVVTLPSDVTLCNTTTSTVITATTTTPPDSYQWFQGTTLLPNTTNQLTVTQSGTYKCLVIKAGCPNSEDTIVVTFNAPTVPTFTQVNPICSGGTLNALPTTSLNGISGTWTPAINNTSTTLYTFTPSTGSCVTTTTMTIEVNNCNAFIYASAVWMDDCTTIGDGKFYNTNGTGTDLINQDGSVFQQNYGIHVQNTGTFILRGAQVKTQKGNSSNICGATLHYRIFTGAPSGAFTTRNLQFNSDCNTGAGTFTVGGGPCSQGQQKWQCVSQPAPCDAPFDFTTLAPGSYTVQLYYTATGSLSNSTGCSDTITLNNGGLYYSATFTIQAQESITSSNPTTCSGNNGTITINNLVSNTTYSISYLFNGNIVSPTNYTSNGTGQIVLNNLGIGSYTNITMLINSCSKINNSVINLTTPSTPTVSVNSPTICIGNNATITATPGTAGSYNYVWTVPTGVNNPGNVATFTTNIAGNYCVTITNTTTLCSSANTCGTLTVSTIVNAGTLAGNQAICIGSTTTFTTNGTTGGAWTSSNTAVATVNPTTGVVTGVSAGTATITYTVTGTGGCPDQASTRIVTVTAPVNAGTLAGNQAICIGSATTFTSNGTTGGVWTSSNTAVATVNASGLINGLTAGTSTITYTVTGTGGCPNVSSTRTVTVTAPVNAGTISGNQNICCNGGVNTFTSNGSAGGTWTSSNSSIATVNATTGVVTCLASGIVNISYTVTGTGGCPNPTPASIVVTVTAPVNAGNLSGNQAICIGSATTFTSNGTTGGVWTSSNTAVATVNASGLINGLTAGTSTITYTVTGTGGCPNQDSTRTVTVTAPVNAGTLAGNQAICIGSTTTFTSNGTTGGAWSSSNTAVATVNASGLINGLTAGTSTITYTVTGTGGCPNQASTRTITVIPDASIQLITNNNNNNNQEVCINTGIVQIQYLIGNSATNAVVTGLPVGLIHSFNSTTNILTITGESNQTGDYNFTVKTVGGCRFSELSGTIKIKTCQIQNGISPGDGNGENDVFDLTGFNVSQLYIYNRYGMKVYEKSNYIKEWGGQDSKGNELPTGTYYYVLELRDGNESRSGWIYINRAQ
jgi:gliding motility-associated-like protein